MKKTALILLLAGFFICNHRLAEGVEGKIMISGHSVQADIYSVQPVEDWYRKIGVSGIFTEDGDTEYGWAELLFMVGSDVVGFTGESESTRQGLSCEVGLKGIIGKAEENVYSGDVGAVALSGQVNYDFARHTALPDSVEVFMGFDYANKILSFKDIDDYLAFHFGVGIPLFESVAVVLEYSVYDLDMNSGPGAWHLDDDRFRIGFSLNF